MKTYALSVLTLAIALLSGCGNDKPTATPAEETVQDTTTQKAPKTIAISAIVERLSFDDIEKKGDLWLGATWLPRRTKSDGKFPIGTR